ncbi:hypothetical protein Tco_0147428, partial [Tanacetum coccineum]
MTLKKLSERQLQIQQCKVQNNDEKNVFTNERQHFEKHAVECAAERVVL